MDINCSETAMEKAIVEAAQYHGWLCVHFRPCRTGSKTADGKDRWATPVAGNGKGFPDLVLVHPKHGILFREDKDRRRQLEPDQEAWRDAIIAAGGDWDLWRPQHFDDVIIPTLTGTPRRTT